MHQREAPSVLKALLQEISENYLGVAPIRSGDSVIIDERSVLPFGIGAGKQGGTALTRPMHYRNVVCGYFLCARAPRGRMSACADGCPAREQGKKVIPLLDCARASRRKI